MLPLESRVESNHWGSAGYVKVAGLREFAAGEFPVPRMALDLRDSNAASPAVIDLPWAGFIVADLSEAPADRPAIALTAMPAIVRPGDVIEVQARSRKVHVRYRRGDNGNVLFATERCNSYCLMCSQPPRDVDDSARANELLDLIDLIDRDEPSLAISGGEPTLLGSRLRDVIQHCAERLPATHIHVLTNGRRFSEGSFASAVACPHPSLTWGIPLYGDHAALHDYVVQKPGAFAETIRGLYALRAVGQRIEIRVVLVRPSVERLQSIAQFIYRNLPFVEHVAFMGTEPIGFARANYDEVWIDPVDMIPNLTESVHFLHDRGIPVSLYNLPLCVLPRPLRAFSRSSISHWKQDFLPACQDCSARSQCGGFFAWTTPKWTSRGLAAITEGDQ